MTPRLLAMLLLVPALIGACASMTENKRRELFDAALRSYENALRWGVYDAAAGVIQHRSGATTTPDVTSLRNIRVTQYSTVRMLVAEDGREVQVDADISFYHEESAAVHTLRDHQVWWFDEASRRWLLDGSLPDFNAALVSPTR